MTTIETTDLLDLGLDSADVNADVIPAASSASRDVSRALGASATMNHRTNTIPDSALNTAEETLTANVEADVESYAIIDLYPEVQLTQAMLNAIAYNESLQEIQQQIDYLESELQASRNALHNQIMDLQNKAKAELVAAQVAADESLVTNALGEPEMMRVMASVLRILQQHNKAGLLMEALNTIEHGTATSTMTRLATTIAPEYNTPTTVGLSGPMYEPSVIPSTTHNKPVDVVEPIQTTAAPATHKRAKWVPN